MLTWEERHRLEQRWFPGIREHIWGRFRAELARHMHPRALVLDAGCGKGSWLLRQHRGRVRALVGVDVVVPDEYTLDYFVQGTLDQLPFPDGQFDVIICNDVIEHLTHPEQSLAEIARVLRRPSRPGADDGGRLFFKTPSLQAPATMLAHLLPYGVHRRTKALLGIPEDNVFPTQFRCNTPRTIHECLRRCGLEREWFALVDETFGYFAFNRPLYTVGLLYSRLMHTRLLAPFRNVMIGIYMRVE